MKTKALIVAMLAAALAVMAAAQDAPPASGASQVEPRMGRGPGGNFQGVGGEITKIEGSTLTLTTFRGETAKVSVGGSTRIMKERAEARLSDLKVGDRVMVRGQQDKNGIWVAEGVRVGGPGGMRPGGGAAGAPPNPADNGKTYIAGTVTKIDGLKLTVKKPDGAEQIIAVDDDTSFRNQRRESVTLADIKVGDQVRGQGEVKGGVFVPRQLTAGEFRPRPEPSADAAGAPPAQSSPNAGSEQK
jgi:Cu/Ag efflux protein CusF